MMTQIKKCCEGHAQPGRSQRLHWLLLILALGRLSACGGEKQEPVPLALIAQDIKFDVNTLTVKAGQPVRLTYTNAGMIDHSLQIEGVLAQHKVRPGQSQTFEFEVERPGSYTYLCALPGHEQAGMVGTLVVE